MKTFRVSGLALLIASAILIVSPLCLFGQKEAPSIAPKKLRNGQTLVAYSVLGWPYDNGIVPTRFELTVSGTTQHPLWPKERSILAEMKDRSLPVTHGMSGSPVYTLGGLLVGSLAFDLGPFSMSGGLAGITPIRAMRDPNGTMGGQKVAASTATRTMIMFGGSSTALMDGLSLAFNYDRAEFQIGVLSSASTQGASQRKPRRIRRGESFTGVLMDGAVSLKYSCTITESTSKGLLGCGHPVFGEQLEYPIFRSKIATTFRSRYVSYKIVDRLLEPAGTMTEDTAFGVRGVHEVKNDLMLPVHLKITIDGRPYDYNFSVVRHQFISTMLIESAFRYLAGQRWSPSNLGTAHIDATIFLRDQKAISIYNHSLISMQRIQFGGQSIFVDPWGIFSALQQSLAAIQQSPWHLMVDKIDVALDIGSGNQILSGDSMGVFDKDPDKYKDAKPVDEVRMGDELIVLVGLHNEKNENFATKFRIKIPEKLDLVKPPNEMDRFLPIQLFLASGNNYQELDPKKIPKGPPGSAAEFLERLTMNKREPSEVFAQLLLPPSYKEKSDESTPPNLEERKWKLVADLKFLRERQTGAEQGVVALSLPRIENAVVSFVVRKQLKLVIREEKPK